MVKKKKDDVAPDDVAPDDVAPDDVAPDDVAPDDVSRETLTDLQDQNSELKKQLQIALVSLDGRLANPEDIPFNEDYLNNPELIAKAITELLSKKPGLKARGVSGDIGAGSRGPGRTAPTSLIDLIRGN